MSHARPPESSGGHNNNNYDDNDDDDDDVCVHACKHDDVAFRVRICIAQSTQLYNFPITFLPQRTVCRMHAAPSITLAPIYLR